MKISSKHSACVGQFKSCSVYWGTGTVKWPFEIPMLWLIPPHCEAGGHPGCLYASNTVTELQRPYSNRKMGPYKQAESFAVCILFLVRKPFPEKLCHQIAFCISTSCSRVKRVTIWGIHSEISVTFHLVNLSTLSTVPFHQVLPRKNGNRSTQPDSWT